ncbi:hypothetical protein C1I95_02150 [Micromonospora craterilacus]|uniref:Uncharacterized protein n=1 Tax=Micromonospora craterilacus TaxID=1655439 RepID=A0A2W2F3B3_9ACTN|nr:hypothetical protein [Micromonospora craterilacus]PZG23849.1 hypothetical protein C1I95_02150 [Micromonospora craterilacus]
MTPGLNETWPVPADTQPGGPVDAARPDDVARAWLTANPRQRADLLADLLGAPPGFGFTVQPPTRERPSAPPPGARVVVVAGSTAAAAVVLPTTALRWYEPARNQIHSGSMRMLGTWAAGRAGDGAGPDGIWYIVLLPAVPGGSR